MSRYIATAAIRGAHGIVQEADRMLQGALKKHGPEAPVAFPNTAYFLPVIYGFTGLKVQKLGELVEPLGLAKKLLPPTPSPNLWLPYLGETLDSGAATLFAEEIIEAIRFLNKEQPEVRNGYTLNGPIDDTQMRSWGIQMVDGRMPGFAAVLGCAKSNEVAVKIVRELQAKGLLVFLIGNVNGRSIIDQLLEEGIDLGYHTFTVTFGTDTISAIYALGYAARAAVSFGGVSGGQIREILLYNKFRCFAFALALGPVDDLKYATAAGAINFGFPAIADTVIPNILPVGVTRYEHVVSVPFDDIPGKNDIERAERLVQRCVEVRGIKVKFAGIPIPVAYGPAFEGEIVRREKLYAECGGKGSLCFELLRTKKMGEVEDGKITVVGPELDSIKPGSKMKMGVVVDVAGRKMQSDFEPVMERQFHAFLNSAEGVQHIGQRDIVWIRISTDAVSKGLRFKHIGDIYHARLHQDFGAILDKVQVTIYTDPAKVDEQVEAARAVYQVRNQRLAGLVDEAVDTFYSCVLCQSFAPNHVCIVSPQRLGLCGAYNWLDCKTSFEINPRGPNEPVLKGTLTDPVKGAFDGINQYVKRRSQGVTEKVNLYSVMDSPMTSCGCFECIMVLIPEANGFMVVSREDPSMTPCGMTFSTLAGTAGGGQQTPGMMGHGKAYIFSPKFLLAEGGLKRVVWMSSILKETLAEDLKAACEHIGERDLLDKIADEKVSTTVEGILPFLEAKGHPALTMEPLI